MEIEWAPPVSVPAFSLESSLGYVLPWNKLPQNSLKQQRLSSISRVCRLTGFSWVVLLFHLMSTGAAVSWGTMGLNHEDGTHVTSSWCRMSAGSSVGAGGAHQPTASPCGLGFSRMGAGFWAEASQEGGSTSCQSSCRLNLEATWVISIASYWWSRTGMGGRGLSLDGTVTKNLPP